MIYCSKCKEVIKDEEKCYQVRYGYWKENDAQDPGEFLAEEDVDYYHEDCYPLKEE